MPVDVTFRDGSFLVFDNSNWRDNFVSLKGDKPFLPIYSRNNEMTLQFFSDHRSDARDNGFSASFRAVEKSECFKIIVVLLCIRF